MSGLDRLEGGKKAVNSAIVRTSRKAAFCSRKDRRMPSSLGAIVARPLGDVTGSACQHAGEWQPVT